MQVGVDVTCMHTSFGGCDPFGFGDMATFQKWPNFPFGAWTIYSPWSSKNSIDRNRLKEFMHVWIDVTCMHTNFGGHRLSALGDIGTFKNGQISLLEHSPWSLKNLINRNWLKKFMQVEIDVTCMHTSFGGRDPSSF